LTRRIDRLVSFFARHWLLLFNLGVAVYVASTLAAPMLMHAGHKRIANLLYLFFKPQCHQLPERSFFLYGDQITYSVQELENAGVGLGSSLHARAAFVGDDQLGYKVAFCQRDLATWGAILLAGLAFGLSGRRWRLLPLWAFALFLLPMAADGLTQFIGLRESTWPLRTISGALFGLGIVWLAYPYVQRAMHDVLKNTVP
jgi:uncharacterized membrane protein